MSLTPCRMHAHSQNHGHTHGAGHSHAHAGPGAGGPSPAIHERAFAVGILLNLGFVGVEAGFGLWSHSLSLLADAGHNLSDVFGLVLAWAAAALSRRLPTERRTYGLRSSSILAALGNAIVLLMAIGIVAWEAVHRLARPEPVPGGVMMAVAAVGILVNGGTAMLFHRGRKGDLNVRGAYLHMAADAAVSLGVVLAGAAMMLTGWRWLDPAMSLIIVGVILWGTWSLLRESLDLALHAVPSGIDLGEVRAYLASLPDVTEVHDLHVWGMSTTETALTAHLVRSVDCLDDGLLDRTAHELEQRFGIHHTTLQLERGDNARPCRLAPDDVV